MSSVKLRSARVGDREYPIAHLPHVGRWVTSIVFLAIAVWLVYVYASSPNIIWNEVWKYLVNGEILGGVWVTVQLSILATVIGLVLGVILAIMELSHNPVTKVLATLYIWFFRGTPVLVQLIFWYNLAFLFPTISVGFHSWNTNDVMTGFTAAMLGLGLNLGAYAAEIVRAGIQAVDVGQTEAAYAVGMTGWQRMRIVVLPQALRIIVPPLGNEFISMLKTTSLVYVVAGADLMTIASQIYRQNNEIIELLIVASIWYMAMTAVATVLQSWLERKYGPAKTVKRTAAQRAKDKLANLTGEIGG